MEFDKLLEELEVQRSTVLERFCGNEMLLQRFICKFPAEKTFEELNSAYQEQDFEEVERAVHTLKGIAANLGFERLYLGCVNMLDDLRGERTELTDEFGVICLEYQRLTGCINCYALNIDKKGLD